MRRTGRTVQPRGQRRRRSQWARVLLAIMVLALGYSLLRLQVFASESYALVAKENRLRTITVRAPRGTIYDRTGQVVAENRVGYQVMLMPAPMDTMRAKLARLAPVLGLTEDDIVRALRDFQRTPHLPLQVVQKASPQAVARLQERRGQFPGVLIHEYPRRYYAGGPAVSHLVGYVAEISREELELPQFEGYQQGRWIGKAGLERQYEQTLAGVPGTRYLEVDARGNIKRWLPEEMGLPAIPGRDLQLYLDLDLQRYAADMFERMAQQHDFQGDKIMGAFVALDPKTGGVLAFYSTPGFDPNLFVGGIPADVWQELNEDETKPLLGRAAASAQPPGSTFKLQVAAMGLEAGVIEPDETMPIPCTGGMSYAGHYARCWSTHGYVNLVGGIKHSCDVYFYQVGIRLGLERFLEMGTRLGFAEKTGIDLPNEFASIFPEDLSWWERRFGYKPQKSEVMSLSIGQGAVTTTPLKMAHMFVPLARDDGKAPAPRLVKTDEEPPITFELPVSKEEIEILRAGMRRVLGPGGTAWLSRVQGWDVMGKTGTAQNPHGDDHGWFVGMGGPKGEDPEIVAAALVVHGLHGSTVSEIVTEGIKFYLDRKYGRPYEPFSVPRQRQAMGLPIDWQWLTQPIEDSWEGGTQ